jgi:hypothetical protein
MANPSNSHESTPSLSTDIERSIREVPMALNDQELLDLRRVEEDAWQHRQGFSRMRGATEPASAYKTIHFTDRQINYLLVILKPYISPISEECRVKLESA